MYRNNCDDNGGKQHYNIEEDTMMCIRKPDVENSWPKQTTTVRITTAKNARTQTTTAVETTKTTTAKTTTNQTKAVSTTSITETTTLKRTCEVEDCLKNERCDKGSYFPNF